MTDTTVTSPIADDAATAVAPVDVKERVGAIARELRSAARKSRSPAVFVSGGGGFKARKGARLFFRGIVASFILFFLIPTIAVSIYFAFIASDQFATETRFALKTGESSVLDSFSGLAGIPSSQQAQESQIIAEYIKSRGMVEAIDSAFDLRKIYSKTSIDYIARFDPSEPIEELVKYWKWRVYSKLEVQSGIITVEVRAFTPEDSLKIAQKIVELSEKLVNQMSERSRQEALRQSREELERAQNKLKVASDAMRNIRNAEGILDAGLVAEASNKIMTVLKVELSGREQEYAVRLKDIAPSAPQMKILAAQIANLKEQIATMNDQLTHRDEKQENGDAPSTTNQKSLAGSMNVLERFQIELNLAQQQYASAAAAYESARVEAEKQQAYLTPFLAPTMAQAAEYPKRWWNWSIFVFPTLLLWFIMLGVAFLIRDHMV